MKLKKRIMKLLVLLAVISTTLLITGCVSTRTETEYICPILFWKEFPELITEYEDETDRVYMSLDEFDRLYKFKNWYEGQVEYYERIKKLYEDEK